MATFEVARCDPDLGGPHLFGAGRRHMRRHRPGCAKYDGRGRWWRLATPAHGVPARGAPSGQESPGASARRSVSHTVEGAAPTRYEIALWPSPSKNRYLKISRTRRMLSLSAAISVLSSATQRKRTFNRQSTQAQPSTSHGGGIISESGGGMPRNLHAFRFHRARNQPLTVNRRAKLGQTQSRCM